MFSSLPMAVMWMLPLGVVLLYNCSAAFRYHARFTFFTLWLMVTSSGPIPLMLLRPRNWRNALIPSWFARGLSWLLGISWEIRGMENVKAVEEGCVVLINHQSALDMLVFAELWPRLGNGAVISKKEVFYLWPFGLATWLWGTIFIDRLNSEKARSTISSTANIIRQKKVKLCMFPEGTRNDGKALLPFKKGAFHVALDAQRPLLPVAVSRYYFLDAKTKKFDGGSNIISILPPVPTKGLGRNDLDELIEKTRAIMDAEVTRISEEAVRRATARGVKVD
ncbi:hypothetical protein R5R35_001513 [Gryllus longicercus]|uniref:1-acyl-sn-glycerol-3-phosphate acyltransferase n=1 Tax=Gryllus longicercus TaxID=2509291 RepID=A0AAN9W1B0_9ORTH